MPEASPFWQNAFLVFVFVIVGWCAWSGWRAGIVREALALGGVFAGGFAGLSVGGILGPLLGRLLPLPGLAIGVLAGLAVGIAVYLAMWLLGALLFKRTAQQRTGLLRFFYGLGGGLIGLFVGVTILWGALLFVRGLGGFYEAGFKPGASSHLPRPNAAAAALVKLKRSIEAGASGRKLESIDVMPPEFYRILDKLGAVAARPAALQRLIEYPPVMEMMRDPKIVAITVDPEVSDAARGQQVLAMIKNPKIVEAANDPALIAKLQKIDIEKALDYALSAPAPTHSPHP
jgi:hypothetical protein